MTYASPLSQPYSVAPPRRVLVLCFDGTGNKFSGNPSDSNIVKIYSLLDRRDNNQWHYYQPGIGTYVETSSLSRKSAIGKIKSWYVKAKDQAIGTSFSEHVMAGYRFLMRYYNDGDAIYFFGFSRGAYTARFLAQMLDYVGLLSSGNEEMLRFAWKTFARWQMRTDETEREKQKKREHFDFMRKFRTTFSRPVCRPEFIGLFDCVNSVPFVYTDHGNTLRYGLTYNHSQFESAWMSRTKFPYTAKTSARFIRHAVAIDERRAKFRQDLISEKRVAKHHHEAGADPKSPKKKPSLKRSALSQPLFRPTPRMPNLEAGSSRISQVSVDSGTHYPHEGNAEEENDQDILELWFAGQHGDIGGGWPLKEGEERPLSDIALMWMLREARKAGLPLDERKVRASNLFPSTTFPDTVKETPPVLQIDGQPVLDVYTPKLEEDIVSFHEAVHNIACTSIVHDSLKFGGGLSWISVLAWRFMEHIPFRRMDLQEDGSWRAISWPLPRGETRDMYHDCKIHTSVIKRMENDPKYRPGNLIVGGGGRGVRRAPEHYGIGSWKVVHEEGDVIGEAYVKALACS